MAMYAEGMQRLDELRALQNLRVPLPLVDGIGRNWGLWRINAVAETQSSVIDDGTAMVVARPGTRGVHQCVECEVSPVIR
jgi:phage protein U